MATRAPQEIIDILNDVLTAELTAINQYFIHGEMCEDWGYSRLYKIVRGHSIGEMKHAEAVIQRILYLKGIPNLQRLGNITVGETVPEQLKVDLALEEDAVTRLNKGIAVCQEKGDFGTADFLKNILVSEEEHISWIESQLELIAQVGEANYLAGQMHGE